MHNTINPSDRQTGFNVTPYEVEYGRKPVFPYVLFHQQEVDAVPPEEYQSILVQRAADAVQQWKDAKRSVRRKTQRQYDAEARDIVFEMGDKVALRMQYVNAGPSGTRLAQRFSGPWIIEQRIERNGLVQDVYDIKHNDGRVKRVNAEKLIGPLNNITTSEFETLTTEDDAPIDLAPMPEIGYHVAVSFSTMEADKRALGWIAIRNWLGQMFGRDTDMIEIPWNELVDFIRNCTECSAWSKPLIKNLDISCFDISRISQGAGRPTTELVLFSAKDFDALIGSEDIRMGKVVSVNRATRMFEVQWISETHRVTENRHLLHAYQALAIFKNARDAQAFGPAYRNEINAVTVNISTKIDKAFKFTIGMQAAVVSTEYSNSSVESIESSKFHTTSSSEGQQDLASSGFLVEIESTKTTDSLISPIQKRPTKTISSAPSCLCLAVSVSGSLGMATADEFLDTLENLADTILNKPYYASVAGLCDLQEDASPQQILAAVKWMKLKLHSDKVEGARRQFKCEIGTNINIRFNDVKKKASNALSRILEKIEQTAEESRPEPNSADTRNTPRSAADWERIAEEYDDEREVEVANNKIFWDKTYKDNSRDEVEFAILQMRSHTENLFDEQRERKAHGDALWRNTKKSHGEQIANEARKSYDWDLWHFDEEIDQQLYLIDTLVEYFQARFEKNKRFRTESRSGFYVDPLRARPQSNFVYYRKPGAPRSTFTHTEYATRVKIGSTIYLEDQPTQVDGLRVHLTPQNRIFNNAIKGMMKSREQGHIETANKLKKRICAIDDRHDPKDTKMLQAMQERTLEQLEFAKHYKSGGDWTRERHTHLATEALQRTKAQFERQKQSRLRPAPQIIADDYDDYNPDELPIEVAKRYLAQHPNLANNAKMKQIITNNVNAARHRREKWETFCHLEQVMAHRLLSELERASYDAVVCWFKSNEAKMKEDALKKGETPIEGHFGKVMLRQAFAPGLRDCGGATEDGIPPVEQWFCQEDTTAEAAGVVRENYSPGKHGDEKYEEDKRYEEDIDRRTTAELSKAHAKWQKEREETDDMTPEQLSNYKVNKKFAEIGFKDYNDKLLNFAVLDNWHLKHGGNPEKWPSLALTRADELLHHTQEERAEWNRRVAEAKEKTRDDTKAEERSGCPTDPTPKRTSTTDANTTKRPKVEVDPSKLRAQAEARADRKREAKEVKRERQHSSNQRATAEHSSNQRGGAPRTSTYYDLPKWTKEQWDRWRANGGEEREQSRNWSNSYAQETSNQDQYRRGNVPHTRSSGYEHTEPKEEPKSKSPKKQDDRAEKEYPERSPRPNLRERIDGVQIGSNVYDSGRWGSSYDHAGHYNETKRTHPDADTKKEPHAKRERDPSKQSTQRSSQDKREGRSTHKQHEPKKTPRASTADSKKSTPMQRPGREDMREKYEKSEKKEPKVEAPQTPLKPRKRHSQAEQFDAPEHNPPERPPTAWTSESSPANYSDYDDLGHMDTPRISAWKKSKREKFRAKFDAEEQAYKDAEYVQRMIRGRHARRAAAAQAARIAEANRDYDEMSDNEYGEQCLRDIKKVEREQWSDRGEESDAGLSDTAYNKKRRERMAYPGKSEKELKERQRKRDKEQRDKRVWAEHDKRAEQVRAERREEQAERKRREEESPGGLTPRGSNERPRRSRRSRSCSQDARRFREMTSPNSSKYHSKANSCKDDAVRMSCRNPKHWVCKQWQADQFREFAQYRDMPEFKAKSSKSSKSPKKTKKEKAKKDTQQDDPSDQESDAKSASIERPAWKASYSPRNSPPSSPERCNNRRAPSDKWTEPRV